jgi:hypothetical protein
MPVRGSGCGSTSDPCAGALKSRVNRRGLATPADFLALSADTLHLSSQKLAGRARLGRAARNRILEEFTVAAVAGRYCELYARFVIGRGGAEVVTLAKERCGAPSARGLRALMIVASCSLRVHLPLCNQTLLGNVG